MFYLFCFVFFNCDLIYCSWSQCCAFPIMPLTSPQSWHRQPGTHQQITCVGVGGGGAPGRVCWCLSLKQNPSSNREFFICQWSSSLRAFFFSFFFCYIVLFFSPENVLFQDSSIRLHTYNERWIMSYKYPHRRSSVRVLTAPAGPFLVPGVLGG